MTRNEAINFLSNTKVYVKNKSREIHQKLFSLGIYLSGNVSMVQFGDAPFLYIGMENDILRISYGSNVETFYGHKYDEITVDDILNITIDEPKYRQFKNAKECWDEMLKHEPFGWIKYKNKTAYSVVLTCADDTNYFHNLFENYTFADGTPFGLKED